MAAAEGESKTPKELLALSALIAVFILVFDLSLPLGVAGGVPYVALILLGSWFPKAKHVFVLAVIASVLTAIGFFLSPTAGTLWVVLTNRGLALFAIWITAVLLANRKKMEKALSESEYRLTQILDNATSGVITIDENGAIQSFNREAETIFGYLADEATGRNVKMLMPQAYAGKHDSFIANYLRTGKAGIIGSEREVEGLRKDGSEFLMELGISEFQSGGKRLFTGLVTDITQRREAEEALRESEEKFRTVVDASPAAITLKDRSGCFLLVNDTYGAWMDKTPQEVMGRTVYELHQKSEADIISRNDLKTFTTGKVVISERDVKFPDGVNRNIVSHKSPIFSTAGEVTAVATVITDITEHKQAEEALRESERRLKAITDNLPGGVYRRILHADETVSYPYMSEEFRRMFGIDPEKTMENSQYIFDRVHPDDVEGTLQSVKTSAETLGSYDCEFRLIGEDGAVLWCRSTAKPQKKENGDIVWDGLVVDITDRKQAEEGLIAARDEADSANRAKSEFLSSMSHELRTPLNAILGFAQLLEHDPKRPLTKKQNESVHQILFGGDHLLTLIDDVLDLAQIESGRFSLNLEAADPAAVFEDCLVITRTLAEKRGVEVIDQTGDTELPPVMIDPVRFKQVLLNLLSNAVKYNRDEGSVILGADETADGMVRVSVTDTGPGIPREKQDQLFQPFSRLGLEATEIQGTGIGLTITKELVELMAGRIGYESAPGKGSNFWVEVPMADDGEKTKRKAKRKAKRSSPSQDAEAQLKPGHTLLYVEDNPANLKLMETLIERVPDMHMFSAHTGELGLELAAAHKPDVILMDINLPGIDGVEALHRLKESPETSDIPVIALTANAMPRDVEAGLKAGFHRYLTKPIRIDEITSALKSALEGGNPTVH